jgi:PAS domain S-box-containing protein
MREKRGSVFSFVGVARDITEQKQTEEKLKASEQNFRNSMDSSLMGIRIMGDADNTFYANQALLDMFGYENIEDLRASPPQEHYTAESYAGFVQRKEQFALGESLPDQLEFDIIRKDGAMRHIQLSSKKVLWNDKLQHQFIYHDITDRKNAEQALQASEQNFRNSIDGSSMGIRITGDSEHILYANQALLDMFGYENIEELRASPPQEHYAPESYAGFIQRKEKYARGESIPDQLEIDIIRKDGAMRHLQLSSVKVLWNGKEQRQTLYNDVTERKQAEKRLEIASREWRTTFDSITDLISIHDTDNRIIRVNKAVADLLNTTPQQLVGKYCHEVLRGDQECPANCPHLLAIKTGKPSSIEIFNSKLGVHLQESASPIININGEITGTVLVARDVTQQKRMEEQLILTDRLASIGELSSGIAHELNNPLTSVIGFSQLLMEGDVPANMKEDLGIVHNEAQRAAAIVKNLLTFARKHAPVKELSQVNTVIEDVLRLRAYEQRVNNIEVENRLSPNLPEIMIDHFQMQQVFLNIMVNAEFAMQEAHHKGKLVVTTEKLDGIIRTSFADDGPGITQENLKRLFDPFFTTKEVGKGTGLGLSICHGIVTEHGGQIYATSEKGQGATFVVELPLSG